MAHQPRRVPARHHGRDLRRQRRERGDHVLRPGGQGARDRYADRDARRLDDDGRASPGRHRLRRDRRAVPGHLRDRRHGRAALLPGTCSPTAPRSSPTPTISGRWTPTPIRIAPGNGQASRLICDPVDPRDRRDGPLSGGRKHRNRYAIPVAGALELARRRAPRRIPTCSGSWLGDGHSYGTQITAHRDDLEIADHIRACGTRSRSSRRTIVVRRC